ncbi:MAG: hypothetical protein CME62_01850 [Halobacteriovoraceae bacterium]|nr:hypothetical protein [Halobacteriovoraceae bacterium]
MLTKIIPLTNVLLSFLPIIVLGCIFVTWKLDWKELLYASLRMLIQLFCIGYFLSYIFERDSASWTLGILSFMLLVASWISLHSIKNQRRKFILHALISILMGAVPVLIMVVGFIIPSESWYSPSFIIPIAGMIFSISMNTIGIAAERFEKEIQMSSLEKSKQTALKACLIPQINSFLAVGLVSLPGMMTGQILSGVDPLIAVRYQIVVMTMLIGAGGLSATIFLSTKRLRV